jgi:hypothetical protein
LPFKVEALPSSGMSREHLERTDPSELCECGHSTSQHEEEEGACEVAGCPCEAMEPPMVHADADGDDDDEAEEITAS